MKEESPSDKVYKILGGKIRRQRLEKRLTQDELAEKLDLTRTSITNIEKGHQKILLHTFLNMADALGVDPSHFLSSTTSETLTIPGDTPTQVRDWIQGLSNPRHEN